MSKLIFLYVDKETELNSDNIPSISIPYKNLKEFKRLNDGEFKPVASYKLDDLLETWGFLNTIKKLKDRIKELESYLIEVVNSMKNNHSYHGDGNKWQCDDEDCSGCFFERKLKRISNDE